MVQNIISKFKTKLSSKEDKNINQPKSHLYIHNSGTAIWSDREFTKFAEEGYIKNVIAYRSITMIAQGAATVPWLLYKKGHKKTLIKHHPLLTILTKPNPIYGGSEFFENLYSYKLISGNAFIKAIRPANNKPTELHILRPDRMSVLADEYGMPVYYRYNVGDIYHDFPINRVTGQSDILHVRNFHPLNDYYGQSPIEAASYSIDQHNQAAIWNQSMLQNGARPSGALIVKSDVGIGGNLTDDQFDRLKSQFSESFQGSANTGRPLILEGGLEWKEMSLSPKDMDFIEAKNSAARDIALAFGVPPQLLGIPGDNTYSNMQEARLGLWEETILPLLDHICDALNNWLVPMYGENLEIGYNKDEISALSTRRDKVWERIERASFLTNNEKRALVGLSPISQEK